jgi:hypothetical protein
VFFYGSGLTPLLRLLPLANALNKEVKVIFGLVRRKVNAARPKIVSIVITTLISGLLVSIPVPVNAAACNATPTTESNGDTLVVFSTVGSCDWQIPTGVTSVRVLAVGGGSSGGAGQGGVWWPQGGAGGAVIDNQSFTVAPGASISIVVGGGGAKVDAHSNPANNGGQSSFATITANGGTAPVFSLAPGGTSGNGNPGGESTGQYVSGGGGGAGGAGNGTTGGIGVNSNISGTTFMYGSGGAGSNGSTGSASSGGGTNSNPPTANRGGGGSQTSSSVGAASAGADGVVIVRYATTCNPTSINVGTDTVLTFANVGSCMWKVPDGVASIWAVAVGGGAAAGVGVSNQWWGAGGGGGQVTSQTISANSGDSI